MPSWLIAFMFGIGVAGWSYTKLVNSNGNAVPSINYGGAAVAGLMAFIVLFTLMKFVFGF